ncbi:MAG TPA: type II toxin-antitoxin system VapC family toxin [Tepidisphaeraceae bacterium]|nr:type II toxin-antitoxin system VapC family toxin [Tepidisphaeraceae bacterium]
MILLDTHIWIWWVQGDPRLSSRNRDAIEKLEPDGLGISVISCWEVAKLSVKGRIVLPLTPREWVRKALAYPGIVVLDLTPEIAIASVELPPPFHADPADRIIVATAMANDIPIVTEDAAILVYPHVRCLQ